ncbi:MAG: glycosyltransferase family A protein [Kiritimatiellae bacterium]|jgi:glycosyltransferase involved in cell wall biosynthesis|nr:glycosyltransferase family A protein [Kiritimatiellia bacterium]
MFLGVVVPLKAKSVSRSWKVTCRSLKATISSLQNQSDVDFVVVVAGHDKPNFFNSINDDRIIFKDVDFHEPTQKKGIYSPQVLINDKNLKIIAGMKGLAKYQPEYVFQLDSDDLIHSDFVAVLRQHEPFDFMTLDGGYFLYKYCNRYITTSNINQYCGSTVIISSRYLFFPESVELESKYLLPWTRYRHMSIYKFFDDTPEVRFARMSDKLIVYVVGSGDNLSDRWRDNLVKKIKWWLKPYLLGRRVGEKFSRDFGLNRSLKN